MTAVAPPARIDSPAAWRGSELASSDAWIYHLSSAEIAEIAQLVDGLRGAGTSREQVTREQVPLRALAPAVRAWRDTLARGRGFVLVRGLPVERMSADAAALAYWALGLHLGTPVPQNFDGELLTDVRDVGADPRDPSTRLYKTRAEQDFHTDGADVIGLLCLHGARRGGESRIVSSVTVYNEIRRRRPDLAATLFRDFYWHYFEPQMPAPTYFVRPICAERGAGLNTFFIPWYIRRAQEIPDVPPLSDEQRATIEIVEATANDPALYLDMEFRPGDVQLLKNSVILHKRTAYDDWEEPDRKRHLLRLWLSAPDFDDGDEQLRAGITLGGASP
ncbi:MAG TPA: TauD/TfdA family dioxygenase [Candidatus Dormibacteraeota bacterium]|nr:TauD/TfdA family dioxygenase [Candidatus Dormibacteraeota bacterium]